MITVTDTQIIIDIADLPTLAVEEDYNHRSAPKAKVESWGYRQDRDDSNLSQWAAMFMYHRRAREDKRLAELREHERKVAYVAAELTGRIDPATLKQLAYLGLEDLPARMATSLLAESSGGIAVYPPKEES